MNVGELRFGTLNAQRPKYWRVIATAASRESGDRKVYILEVAPDITPHSSRLPIPVAEITARKNLTAVSECVRHSFMDLKEEEIDQDAKTRRDTLYQAIEGLVSPTGIRLLLDPSTRPNLLSEHSERFNVLPQNLRKMLTRFWWFGCDKNALLKLTPLKGGPGRTRDRPTRGKRGTRNAIAQDNPTSPLRGVNYDETHRERFIFALESYWAGEGLSLAASWRRMKDQLYVTRVVCTDGTVRFRRIPANRVPTLGIFYRVAKRLIAELELKGANLGDLDFQTQIEKKSGAARDIASGPLDIFDMDATEFNFELVAAYDRRKRIGKPTVYVVVDRFSSYIVGLYLDCRPEHWDGYRRALYCAFTEKTGLLDRLGITKELGKEIWIRYGVPNGVFCDRGPARGKNALSALCERLGLAKASPGPHRPDLNAVVESLHAKMQELLSEYPGGYTRRSGERAATRRKNARANATFTDHEFLSMLIAAAHDHNTNYDARAALRPEMVGVDGTPDEIFAWGLRNSFVEHQALAPAEIYAALLPKISARSVTPKGVRHDNMHFSSEELQAWRKSHPAKFPKTDLYLDADPHVAYWICKGLWRELEMVKNDAEKTRGYSWLDIEMHSHWLDKNCIERKAKAHRTAAFSKVAAAQMRNAMDHAPTPLTASEVKNQSVKANRRTAEGLRQQENAQQGKNIMRTLTRKGSLPIARKKKRDTSRDQSSSPTRWLPSISHLRARRTGDIP